MLPIILLSNSLKRSCNHGGNNSLGKASDFQHCKGEWSIDSFASKKTTCFRHHGPLMFIY